MNTLRTAFLWGNITFCLLYMSGCHQGSTMVDAALEPATHRSGGTTIGFLPAQVTILPITRVSTPPGDQSNSYIHVYVGLEDVFQCHLKAPGTFRFELNERVTRSGQPKGKRLLAWPDIVLETPTENHHYWRDYLRCYEFRLDLKPGTQQVQDAILQVTFLSEDSRRLTDLHELDNKRK